MALRDQLVELGVELAARLSSQEHAVANARSATTALSRARVERDAVELFLSDHLSDDGNETGERSQESRASGS